MAMDWHRLFGISMADVVAGLPFEVLQELELNGAINFQVHHILNGATRYGLENVAHLDKLPPRGFNLIIAPIKIENGSGGPTRSFAILPNNKAATK